MHVKFVSLVSGVVPPEGNYLLRISDFSPRNSTWNQLVCEQHLTPKIDAEEIEIRAGQAVGRGSRVKAKRPSTSALVTHGRSQDQETAGGITSPASAVPLSDEEALNSSVAWEEEEVDWEEDASMTSIRRKPAQRGRASASEM